MKKRLLSLFMTAAAVLCLGLPALAEEPAAPPGPPGARRCGAAADTSGPSGRKTGAARSARRGTGAPSSAFPSG